MSIDGLLEEIRLHCGEELPFYSALFKRAVSEVPPVFLTREYESFFWECAASIPNWLPRVVAACAVTEGRGAHSLLEVWSRVHGHQMAEDGLLSHAKDEAAHARLFLKLARLAFEDNYAVGNLDDVESSLQPIRKTDIVKSDRDAVSDRMLVDYMMQLNIVEIRTRKNLLMMAPMYYQLTPKENRSQVERILQSLEQDEMSHISYTARVIESSASQKNVDRLGCVYMCRMQNYNDHTIEHCDATKYDYGQGKIPMLFAPACGGACRLNHALQ